MTVPEVAPARSSCPVVVPAWPTLRVPVMVVVANVVVPLTVKLPEKVGLLMTAKVEVPVLVRLVPAVIRLAISTKLGAAEPLLCRT